MSEQKTPLIFRRLAEVAGKMGAVPKSERNRDQGYSFRGIVQLVDAVHTLLADAGIVVIPEVVSVAHQAEVPTKTGGRQFHLRVVYKHTFYCAEDGSSVSCSTIGEALDSSDKAGNKTMSCSLKYALNEVLMVAYELEEGDESSPEIGTGTLDADFSRTAPSAARTAAPRPNSPPESTARAEPTGGGAAAPPPAPPFDEDFSGGDPLIDQDGYDTLLAAIEETSVRVGIPSEKLQLQICTSYKVADLYGLTCTQLPEIAKRLAAMQRPAAPPAPAPKPAPAGGKTCPECGKPMKLRERKDKSGKFWGCTGYPECHGIVNV